MPSRYTYKEIEIDLSEFDTEELKEELEARGVEFPDNAVDGEKVHDLIQQIWQKRRTGFSFDEEIDQLIWEGIGKIV